MSECMRVQRIRIEIDTSSKYILEHSWLLEYFFEHEVREVSEFRYLLTLIDCLPYPICSESLREDLIVVWRQEKYISILEDDIVIDESDERSIV